MGSDSIRKLGKGREARGKWELAGVLGIKYNKVLKTV